MVIIMKYILIGCNCALTSFKLVKDRDSVTMRWFFFFFNLFFTSSFYFAEYPRGDWIHRRIRVWPIHSLRLQQLLWCNEFCERNYYVEEKKKTKKQREMDAAKVVTLNIIQKPAVSVIKPRISGTESQNLIIPIYPRRGIIIVCYAQQMKDFRDHKSSTEKSINAYTSEKKKRS